MANQPFVAPAPGTYPPIASLTAIVATTETVLFQPLQFTNTLAADFYPGKQYLLRMAGIMSFNTTGSLTITPRFGNLVSSPPLGANVITFTAPGAGTTANAWFLEFLMTCRTLGAVSANSTVIGNGFFVTGNTATASCMIPFGGTPATVDPTLGGIWIGWTLSVAGTVTPQQCSLQSLT